MSKTTKQDYQQEIKGQSTNSVMPSQLEQYFYNIFNRKMTKEEKQYLEKNKIQTLEKFCSKFDQSLFKNSSDNEKFNLLKFLTWLQIDIDDALEILKKLETLKITNIDQLLQQKPEDLKICNLKEEEFERISKYLQKRQSINIPQAHLQSSKINLTTLKGEDQNNISQNKQENLQQREELLVLKKKCQSLESGNFLYPIYDPTKIGSNVDDFISIMVIGEVGSGKTSFLNYLLNNYLGISYNDKQKFILQNSYYTTKKEVMRSYIQPFNNQKGLKLIDTPGIGNERDPSKSKQIIEEILQYLRKQEYITCICFVVQSSNSRLTQTQNYLLGNIFQIFGNSILQNIKFIFTFCDNDTEPKSLEALRFQGDKYHQPSMICSFIDQLQQPYYFKVTCLDLEKLQQVTEHFRSFYWNMTMKNITPFIQTVQGMKPFILSQCIQLQNLNQKLKIDNDIKNTIGQSIQLMIKYREKQNIQKLYFDKNNEQYKDSYYQIQKNLTEQEIKCFQLVKQICMLEKKSIIDYIEYMINQNIRNGIEYYDLRVEFLNNLIKYKVIEETFLQKQERVENLKQ